MKIRTQRKKEEKRVYNFKNEIISTKLKNRKVVKKNKREERKIIFFISKKEFNYIRYKGYLETCWERFEKFYSDREAHMIEGEERYHAKLLSLS